MGKGVWEIKAIYPDLKENQSNDSAFVKTMSQLKKYLVPGDYLLIVFILFLAGAIHVLLHQNVAQGETAIVSVNGEEVYRLSLKEIHDIPILGTIDTVHVQTNGSQIWLHGSPCPYKICEKMGKIHLAGELIVCVPNRVLVRILPQKRDDLDATTM